MQKIHEAENNLQTLQQLATVQKLKNLLHKSNIMNGIRLTNLLYQKGLTNKDLDESTFIKEISIMNKQYYFTPLFTKNSEGENFGNV